MSAFRVWSIPVSVILAVGASIIADRVDMAHFRGDLSARLGRIEQDISDIKAEQKQSRAENTKWAVSTMLEIQRIKDSIGLDYPVEARRRKQ